jgi:flagellar protein FliT
MVEAAKASDWDRLVSLEQDCRVLTNELRHADTGPAEGRHFTQRKFELLRKALADDAKVRECTEPWMHQLTQYLGSARQQHRLQNAYGANA